MDSSIQDVPSATIESTDEKPETDQITNNVETESANNEVENIDISTFALQNKHNTDSEPESDSSFNVQDHNYETNNTEEGNSVGIPDDFPNITFNNSNSGNEISVPSNNQKSPTKDRSVHGYDSDEDQEFTKQLHKGHRKMIHSSDSEDDSPNVLQEHSKEGTDVDVEEKDMLKNKKKSKYKRFVTDSDSESESNITLHNKSFTSEAQCGETDLGIPVPETSTHSDQKGSRWSKLCDSESSEDEQPKTETKSLWVDELEEENIRPVKYKRKSQSKRKDEPKKMTRKDAQVLNKQIQAESQRMIREMNVTLPYHKPKQFTLKEFMSSRPKLASAVPLDVKVRPSVAIKLCSEKLEEISKNIEKREEKLKEFYKSESESDCNDSDSDYIPPTDDQNDDVPDISESVEKAVQSCIDSQESASADIDTNSTVIPETPMDTNCDEKAVDSGIETQELESEGNEKSITVLTDASSEGSGVDSNLEKDIQGFSKNVECCQSNINESSCIPGINENSITNCESGHVIVNEINTEIRDNKEGHIEDVKSKDAADNKNNIHSEVCIPIASRNSEADVLADNTSGPIESMDYEFNLDDIEESTEPMMSKDKENPNSRSASNVKILQNIVIEDSTGASSEKNSECSAKQEVFNPSGLDVVIEDSSDKTGSPSLKVKQKSSNLSELDVIENSIDQAVGLSNQYENNEVDQRDLELAQLDREIENFNPYNQEADNENKKISKLKLLSEKLSNHKPRLSGNPDEVIDLDSGVTRPSEVCKLMQRFIQHTTKKHVHRDKVKFNVINIEGGEAHKETLAINVDDDENMAIEEKPGVRLHRLREELQKQIAARRSELWQKKTITEKTAEGEEETEKNPYDGEKSECGAEEDALLDMDDEEEISESSEGEEVEEELDENEEDEKDKRKSAFIDGEAEECDEGGEECDNEDEVAETSENEADDEAAGEEEAGEFEDEDENSNDSTTKFEKKSHQNEDDDENSKGSAENIENNKTHGGKRVLRRIVKGFTEDSDDDEDEAKPSQEMGSGKRETNTELSQDDEVLPCHQPQNPKTPVSHLKSRTKSDFEFLTPVNYLTGIQNLSASKNLKQSPTFSPFRMPTIPSPLKGQEWHSDLQKKLFTEAEITNSQTQAMKDLCKTSFSSTQDEPDSTATTVNTIPKTTEHDLKSGEIVCTAPSTTQDLLGICSGSFTGASNICDNSAINGEPNDETITCSDQPTTQDILDICSGAFTGVSQVDTSNLSEHSPPRKAKEEIKSLDPEQDIIISQLLDEEEMEKFKRKFDSPIYTNTQKRIVEDFEREVTGGGVIDSDEDEELDFKNKKSRRQKKIMFSDDEDSNDLNGPDQEKIDLQDDVEGDEEDEDDVPPENVEYDSEENEYEVVHEDKQKTKASDFFEDEAELSESEWGSEDEDEKDLDAFEMEKGDEDKFDEKKLRTDLEKIHMRRLLDDDTREVKILQELLLEDGEMHGSGRERQFRWRNIDSQLEEGEERKDGDDECYLEEDESEEQWRRKRYERELFLQEQMRKKAVEEDELLAEGSQLLKFGQKVVQKMSMRESQGSQGETQTDKLPGSPVLTKCSFTLSHTRGSFLNRKDQVLQRLAVYNKDTTVTVGSAKIALKNSKNFVFQSITVEEEETSEKFPNKRKASDDTPNIIKKLRLSDNLSPADAKRKSKTPSSKTRLFDNLMD
ncbi:unnamed protein product [Callosobruchus maculatus]|uniref:Claspin n=1 Tax=Callosobruchus maculatus TaxID=64391 RepID=A0A653DHI5_CALMS|nr:unnamed protein product [Callosobruchus maculatus]